MCPPKKPKAPPPPPPPPAAPPPPSETAAGFGTKAASSPSTSVTRYRRGTDSLRVDLAVPNSGGSGPYVP